jgi:hypothetical protein
MCKLPLRLEVWGYTNEVRLRGLIFEVRLRGLIFILEFRLVSGAKPRKV